MICDVDLELTPVQPPEIEAAVASALEQAATVPDPWWAAGIEDALET